MKMLLVKMPIMYMMIALMAFVGMHELNTVKDMKELGVNDSTVVNVGIIIEDGQVIFCEPTLQDLPDHPVEATHPLRRNNP